MSRYVKITVAVLTLGILGGLSSASAGPGWGDDALTFFKHVHENDGIDGSAD